MTFQKTTGLLAGACSLLALAAGAAPAQGQESGAAQAEEGTPSRQVTIEEIVVRGLTRERSLQDAPAMISTFTERDIENIGVDSMRDFTKLVPNLYFAETQNRSFTFINIRGVSQMRNLDPSVALVVDGVLSTSPIALSQELFDIEHIEVLKGPQGALYGRNAIGGAIVIDTKRPGNEFEGFLRAEVGNGSLVKGQASANIPLVKDKLFWRQSFSAFDDNGFRRNVILGKNADAQENFSSRTRLLWEASDSFHADFRFSFSRDRGPLGSFVDTAPIFHEIFPGAGISLGQAVGAFQPLDPRAQAGPVVGGPSLQELFVPGQIAGIGNPNLTSIPIQDNFLGNDQRKVWNASILMEYVTDFATFRSVSSWDRQVNLSITGQPPRTQIAAAKNTQFRLSDAFSQDFRVLSPDDQRFRWMFGGYVVRTDSFLSVVTQRDTMGLDSLDFAIKTTPFAGPGPCEAFPFPIGGPTDNQGDCVLGFDGDEQDNIAYAFYGVLNYDLTETIELEFSGRWDRDERDQIVRTPERFFVVPTDLEFGDVRSANFSDFQPKGVVRWSPTNDLMMWASYAEGFRSGSFNRAGVKQLADALREDESVGLTIPGGVVDVFDEQRTASIDGGIKYSTPNRRLTVNVAGFWTDFDNLQTFGVITLGTTLTQNVITVDDANAYGAELDLSYLVFDSQAFGALNAQVAFGWTEGEIKKDPARNLVGNDIPLTPQTTTNLTLQYNKTAEFFDTDVDFFLRSEYQRIGEMFFQAENFAVRDVVHLVNLRGGLELVEDGWRLEGWVKNLGQEDFFVDFTNGGGLAFFNKKRQWGFELTKRF